MARCVGIACPAQLERRIRQNVPEIGEYMGDAREVQPGVLFFPVFGNVTAFLTGEGVVLFDSGTAQLNSMGQKRLQFIVAQAGTPSQVVYVQRTSSTTETELRLEQVRKELLLPA